MHQKSTILNALNDTVNQFNAFIENLNQAEFEVNPNHKWSAGQDLVHLIKLLRILNIGYALPKGLLKMLYGSNKKATRSFDQLKLQYKTALAGGAKSPALYIPKPVLFDAKENLIKKHQALNEKFIAKISKLTETDLDTIQLPHPILGKVTLGEMAFFTSFHTEHHYELLQSKLKK
jgi:hypothetical protein